MPERIGRCTNYENCSLAYRNKPVRIEDSENNKCPECGQRLREAVEKVAQIKTAAKQIGTLFGIIAFGALLIGVFLLTRSLQETSHSDTESKSATPPLEPSPQVRIAEPVKRSRPRVRNAVTVLPAVRPDGETDEMPVVVPRITASTDAGVKRDVLARIDAMPNLNSHEKNNLHAQVNRARALMKVVTIPFGTGSTELSSSQANTLCSELQGAGIQRLTRNPTVVFVILGFADKAGDPAKNIRISQKRAEGVQQALRDTCGLANITHPVGMGGSELFGAENRDKNRVAEVWAVLP